MRRWKLMPVPEPCARARRNASSSSPISFWTKAILNLLKLNLAKPPFVNPFRSGMVCPVHLAINPNQRRTEMLLSSLGVIQTAH